MKADTLRFFEAIFERKPDDLRAYVWTKGDDAKRTSYPLSAESATDKALAAAVDSDVYVGVGFTGKDTYKEVGPKRRPGKVHIVGLPGLWADIDVNGGPEGKTGAAENRDAAIAVASSLLPPSMLVDSGYGVQAYWLFDETWVFASAEERAGAQELEAKWLKALAAAASFDKLDPTHDPSRVLRVPGTFNRKGGLDAPVRLLDFNEDARYELTDFEPHVVGVQLTLGSNGNGATPADEIVVSVNRDAKPPFEKFEALREADELFDAAWKHDATGDPKRSEWSASEWDLSLTDRTVRARWNDQEITDLLVAHRVKYGSDLKRPDYYARTIARARATIELGRAEERRAEAISELTAPPVSSDDYDPNSVLKNFETVINVPVARFVQYGRDPDEGGSFELVLAGAHKGRRVRFPSFDELVNPMKFRNRIATATSTLPPRYKGEDWDDAIRALLRVVEVHDAPDETSVGVLEDWLVQYVGVTEAKDRSEALRSGYPHRHEGNLFVKREHLQHFLLTRFGERIKRRELTALLKQAGFVSKHVPYRKSDGSGTSTTLFVREDGES